jgi:SAM-dependent methyltransferase
MPVMTRLRRLIFGVRFHIITQYLLGLLPLPWRILLKRVTRSSKPLYRPLPTESAFDKFYAVKTAGKRRWQDLGTGAPSDAFSQDYIPSPPTLMRKALSFVPDHETFTFVDLGCGMGRTLIIASEFNFRAILGVEKAPELCDLARTNLQSVRSRFPDRTPMQVVQADAATWTLPTGNLVIYLYDPFGKPVIKAVVRLIEEALRQERRRLFVIYYDPDLRRYFDQSPLLQPDPFRSFIMSPDDERLFPLRVAVWQQRS